MILNSNPKASAGAARPVQSIFVALLLILPVTSIGCGGKETTVIEPETYELTEQEADNRERARKMLAEQRQ